MALHQVYASEPEIPAAVREHYAEKEGKWLLQTDPPTEDVTGLKTALASERNLRRDAEKQATDMKTRYEGIDPDEVHKLRERVKDLDDSDVYDKKGIDALVEKRTKSMQEEHQRLMAVKERELTHHKGRGDTFEQKYRNERISTTLMDAITRAGVTKTAVQDAVQRGLGVFTELDDTGKVLAKVGGETRYGKDGISPLSPDEWIAGLKQEAPHLWPPSSGGGASNNHGIGSNGFDWNSITDPAERLTRFREHQAGH